MSTFRDVARLIDPAVESRTLAEARRSFDTAYMLDLLYRYAGRLDPSVKASGYANRSSFCRHLNKLGITSTVRHEIRQGKTSKDKMFDRFSAVLADQFSRVSDEIVKSNPSPAILVSDHDLKRRASFALATSMRDSIARLRVHTAPTDLTETTVPSDPLKPHRN